MVSPKPSVQLLAMFLLRIQATLHTECLNILLMVEVYPSMEAWLLKAGNMDNSGVRIICSRGALVARVGEELVDACSRGSVKSGVEVSNNPGDHSSLSAAHIKQTEEL